MSDIKEFHDIEKESQHIDEVMESLIRKNQGGMGILYGLRNDKNNQVEKLRKKVKQQGNSDVKAVKEDKENKLQQRSNLKYKGRFSGYVIVPDEVTYAGENLTHAEFRLWVILRKHAREIEGTRYPAFPGRKRIARMMGLKSLNQITQLIKSLEEKKVIKIEHRHLGKTNNYLVFDPPKKWATDMKKLLKITANEEKNNPSG